MKSLEQPLPLQLRCDTCLQLLPQETPAETKLCAECQETQAPTDSDLTYQKDRGNRLRVKPGVHRYPNIPRMMLALSILVCLGCAAFFKQRLDSVGLIKTAEFAEEQQETVIRELAQPREESYPIQPVTRASNASEAIAVPAKSAAPVSIPEPSAVNKWTEQFLERLNRQRNDAGLDSVILNPDLCDGCNSHAIYLTRNVSLADVNFYREDPGNPAYSEMGKKTARIALVFCAPLPQCLDAWLGRLSSRVQLLNPRLRSLGVGFAMNSQHEFVCVVDAFHGCAESWGVYPVASERPGPTVANGIPGALKLRLAELGAVIYPYAGQTNVPCDGIDLVSEDSETLAGFPITVIFPAGTKLRDVRATMTDGRSDLVNVLISSPEKPFNGRFQSQSIGLHPIRRLQPDQNYTVTVAVTANGREWWHRWEFKTAPSR